LPHLSRASRSRPKGLSWAAALSLTAWLFSRRSITPWSRPVVSCGAGVAQRPGTRTLKRRRADPPHCRYRDRVPHRSVGDSRRWPPLTVFRSPNADLQAFLPSPQTLPSLGLKLQCPGVRLRCSRCRQALACRLLSCALSASRFFSAVRARPAPRCRTIRQQFALAAECNGLSPSPA